MDSTISLESVYGDSLLVGKNNTTKQASQAFAKNGLMGVFFESCEDSSVYAAEAANQYQLGCSYARMASITYEAMARDIMLTKKANAKAKALGLESAVLSMEAIDVKGGFRKVVLAVRAALQRFLSACANLIKTIST